MRKTIAIIIAAVMTAVLLIPAGAVYEPAGTAIKTAEDWAAMSLSGTYYLDADITVDKTVSGNFKGTVNGNNHTVTTSVSLFEKFNGTVRDLTINGSITATRNSGALALNVTEKAVVWNVTNNADVTISKTGQYAAGFVAYGSAKSEILFYNCRNNGNVSYKVKNISGTVAGGFVASGDSVYCYNCENHGNLTSGSASAIVGGFVGRGASSVNCSYVDFEYCRNYGAVTSTLQAGGMSGYVGTAENISPVGFRYHFCENHGDVTGGQYVGGIAGYGYGSGGGECFDLCFCINTGTITGGQSGAAFVSQLGAYCNSKYHVIKYNLAAGKTVVASGKKGVTCVVSGSGTPTYGSMDIRDNWFVKGSEPEWFSCPYDASNAQYRKTFTVAAQDGLVTLTGDEGFESGEFCMFLNRYIGYNCFNQELGVDKLPTTRLDAPHVVYDMTVEEDRFINSENTRLPMDDMLTYPVDPEGWHEPYTDAPETVAASPASADEEATLSPETTAADGEKSGCGSSVGLCALLPVLVAGAALIRKKKER